MLCCTKPKEAFVCEVILLDGSTISFSKSDNIKLSTKVHVLLDLVCQNINLIEKDYFGLKYLDEQSKQHWLDVQSSFNSDLNFLKAIEQMPCTLYFGVKYYALDPCLLKEEMTRYQFFLQLKQDVLNGKLTCPWKRSAELSALALQSEIGDYSPSEHKRGYVSEFRFIPHQDEQFESEVSRLHASYCGLIPSSAELQYLKKCRQVDMYGVELHSVTDARHTHYQLGISPRGVETFKNKRRLTVFYWPQIKLVNHRGEELQVQVQSKPDQIQTHKFMAANPLICKQIYKNITHCHAFYRSPNHNAQLTWSKKQRYNSDGGGGKSKKNNVEDREEPEVLRLSSKRYPPRDNSHLTAASRENLADDNFNENLDPNTSSVMTSQVKPAAADDKSGRSWEELDKSSMFQVNERGGGKKFMTPTSERKERHERRLKQLSDNETRTRRHHRGRSSGEDSDSPSKRRIKNRRKLHQPHHHHHNNHHHHARSKNYFTDTEVFNGYEQASKIKQSAPRTPNSRRNRNRLSREDETARQQLWQHIRKEAIEPSRVGSGGDSSDFNNDIPYTEVRTFGNPNPRRRQQTKVRRPSYKRSNDVLSAYAAVGRSYEDEDDGLVAPLQVTTNQTTYQHYHRQPYHNNHHHHNKTNYRSDWDTRANLSDNYSVASTTRSSRTRRKKRTTTQQKQQKNEARRSDNVVYTQI